MSIGGLVFKRGTFENSPWFQSFLTGSDRVLRNGLHLNFITMKYDVLGGDQATIQGDIRNFLTYSNPSNKTILTANGVWETANTLRCSYDTDGTPLGLLVEGQRTNIIQYNSVFTPNVTPTNWGHGFANTSNLTREIVVATRNGIPCVGYKWYGTANSSSAIFIQHVNSNWGLAAANQTWTMSGFLGMNVHSGVAPSSIVFRHTLISPANAGIAQHDSASLSPNTTLQRFVHTAELTSLANVAYVQPLTRVGYTSGVFYNFTLWFGYMQEELGNSVSSPIVTNGASVTRTRDDIKGVNSIALFASSNEGTLITSAIVPKAGINASGVTPYIAHVHGDFIDDRYNITMTNPNLIRGIILANAVSEAILINGVIYPDVKIRSALGWEANNAQFSSYGYTTANDTSFNLTTPKHVRIGSYNGGDDRYQLDGYIQEITYYPYKLSASELQNRTYSDSIHLDFINERYEIVSTANGAVLSTGNINNILTYSSPYTKYVTNVNGYLVPGTTLRCNYVEGNARGLLVEEQRTNYFPRSELTSGGTGVVGSGQANTTNVAMAPDGTMTGCRVIEQSVSSEHYVNDGSIAVLANTIYTWSAFVKPYVSSISSVRYIMLRLATATTDTVFFNMANGQFIGTATGNTISYGSQAYANGWTRIWHTFRAHNNVANIVARVQMTQNLNTGSAVYQGDGESGFYLWGRQFEAGNTVSSYIKTEPNQTATRTADTVRLLRAHRFTSNDTSVLLQYRSSFDAVLPRVAGGLSNTSNPQFNNNIYWLNPSTLTMRGQVSVIRDGILSVSGQQTGSNQNNVISVTTRISQNNFAHSVNGASVSANGLAIMPNTQLDQFIVGRDPWLNGANYLNEHVQKIRIIPRALSNTELRDLANTG